MRRGESRRIPEQQIPLFSDCGEPVVVDVSKIGSLLTGDVLRKRLEETLGRSIDSETLARAARTEMIKTILSEPPNSRMAARLKALLQK